MTNVDINSNFIKQMERFSILRSSGNIYDGTLFLYM